jgi:hypothetical protein
MFEVIQIGDAVEHDGVTIAPLFPRKTPTATYLTLDEALPRGLEVDELDAGTVPELVVHNPLDSAVLLYDGEELVGALQNRILNLSVLIPPRTAVKIPVSCVEQGRWRWRSRRLAKGGHAYPELRRQKASMLAADPLARGVAQAAVWHELSEKSARHDVHSSTGAHSDLFAAFRHDLDEMRRAFPLQPGQSGAVLVLGSRVCLDWVSRPDAFGRLYPTLLDGYLLDALEPTSEPTADVEAFASTIAATPTSRAPSAGLGADLRLTGGDVLGSGLEVDGELLQLSAFSRPGQCSGMTPEGG